MITTIRALNKWIQYWKSRKWNHKKFRATKWGAICFTPVVREWNRKNGQVQCKMLIAISRSETEHEPCDWKASVLPRNYVCASFHEHSRRYTCACIYEFTFVYAQVWLCGWEGNFPFPRCLRFSLTLWLIRQVSSTITLGQSKLVSE